MIYFFLYPNKKHSVNSYLLRQKICVIRAYQRHPSPKNNVNSLIKTIPPCVSITNWPRYNKN